MTANKEKFHIRSMNNDYVEVDKIVKAGNVSTIRGYMRAIANVLVHANLYHQHYPVGSVILNELTFVYDEVGMLDVSFIVKVEEDNEVSILYPNVNDVRNAEAEYSYSLLYPEKYEGTVINAMPFDEYIDKLGLDECPSGEMIDHVFDVKASGGDS